MDDSRSGRLDRVPVYITLVSVIYRFLGATWKDEWSGHEGSYRHAMSRFDAIQQIKLIYLTVIHSGSQ